MSTLNAAKRNALPNSEFALPKERKYPIHTRSHAIDALSRVSANGTPEQQAQVRKAIHAKYHGLPANPNMA